MKWTAAVLGIGFLVWFAWTPSRNAQHDSARASGGVGIARDSAGRKERYIPEPDVGRFAAVVYPYSVIPGGVDSVAELRSALDRDPLIAQHYAGFDLARARLVRLDRDRAAYVSYRLGDHIYWTSHKVRLAKGEALITDGNRTVRTRCGNLVAQVARRPVSPQEPSTETLDTPLPLDFPPASDLPLESTPVPEWILAPPTIEAAPPDSGGAIILVPPILYGDGPLFPPTVPTAPTPEPATLILVSSGLAALLALRKRRGKS